MKAETSKKLFLTRITTDFLRICTDVLKEISVCIRFFICVYPCQKSIFQRPQKSHGFTLIELLIASSIFVVIMVTIYSAFHTGIFGVRNIEKNIEVYQAARLALERINLDLRNSFTYSTNESKFEGMVGKISFLTLIDSYQSQSENITQDYAFVSYQLEGNSLMRMCRKNQQSLNENSGVQSEEMISNVEEITFNYGRIGTDNNTLEFLDAWDPTDDYQKKNLPAAIKVTLTILKDEIKEEFRREIFLPLVE